MRVAAAVHALSGVSLSAAQERAALFLDQTLARCVLKERQAQRWIVWCSQRVLAWPPQGVYISGSVGMGKSVLIDGLHAAALEAGVRSVRIHWHEWIRNVHRSLHAMRELTASHEGKLRAIGDAWSAEHSLVCFDEMSVSDVCDALILREILGRMLESGVELVATSNRAPFELYERGLNRELFLPFVGLIERSLVHCDLNRLASDANDTIVDHRRVSADDDSPSLYLVGASTQRFRAACAAAVGSHTMSPASVEVAYGRSVELQVAEPEAGAAILGASFSQLCDTPLAAADYHVLFARFDALLLTDLPRLTLERHDIARRFLSLVDVVYETRSLFVAQACVDIDDLLADDIYVKDDDLSLLTVRDQGGSSGRPATFVGDAEWSATGRKDASLGAASGLRDTHFSFARLKSRLIEMTRSQHYRAAWRRRIEARRNSP